MPQDDFEQCPVGCDDCGINDCVKEKGHSGPHNCGSGQAALHSFAKKTARRNVLIDMRQAVTKMEVPVDCLGALDDLDKAICRLLDKLGYRY